METILSLARKVSSLNDFNACPCGCHDRLTISSPGLPFIGRVHDVPPEATWLKFYEWSKTYGPIYEMNIFGTSHVWISDEKIAHDLLTKRNAVYSDRPVIPNLPDNRTSGDYLALLGRTETWKRQRKLCHHLMTTSAQASLHGYPPRRSATGSYTSCPRTATTTLHGLSNSPAGPSRALAGAARTLPRYCGRRRSGSSRYRRPAPCRMSLAGWPMSRYF